MPNNLYLEPVPEGALGPGAALVSPAEQIGRAVRKRYWWGILVFILAAPAAVGLAIWKNKPYYQAQAVIQLNPVRTRILYRMQENEPARSYDSFFQTQMATVQSDSVLNQCLADPAIGDTPLLAGAEEPVRALRDALRVERIGRTQLFRVSLRQEQKPQGLAYTVNAVVDAYLTYLEEKNVFDQGKILRLLDEQRKKLEQDFNNKKAAVAKKRDELASHPYARPAAFAIDPVSSTQQAIIDAKTRQSSLKVKKTLLEESLETDDVHVLSTLVRGALSQDHEIERLKAMSARLIEAQVTAEVEAANPSVLKVQEQVNMDPEIRRLKEAIAEGELERELQLETFQASHPSVTRTKAVLEATKNHLAKKETVLREKVAKDMKDHAKQRAKELRSRLGYIAEQIKQRQQQMDSGVVERLREDARADIARQIRDLEADIKAQETREKDLTDLLKTNLQQRTDYERKAAELKSLEEDMARTLQSLRGVEQRRHELAVESGAPGYASLLSPATQPKAPEPYVGRRIKYSVVAVVGAAGIALLAMILLERRDDRIWSAEDLVGSAGVELLGSVPDGGRQLRGPTPAALVCQSDPNSIFAENLRNVMAGVLYPTDGKPARTVLVTSAAPGDGKTIMAVNLATCIASLGKRVLLIDANFRKPDIASIFSLGNIPGLGDILAYGDSLAGTVHSGGATNLNVLTAGTPPPQPGLLGSSAMKEALEQFSAEHDYVIIDAPPLMLADARILAPLVDGVVCTFRALTSRRSSVEDSLGTLRRLGARTIGIALTGVNIKHDGFGRTIKALKGYRQTEQASESS